MRMFALTPETAKIETRAINLGCPKFLWRILEARAESLHQGDLELAINELFAVLITDWLKEATKGVYQAPVNMN